jgi:hypothetical protein
MRGDGDTSKTHALVGQTFTVCAPPARQTPKVQSASRERSAYSNRPKLQYKGFTSAQEFFDLLSGAPPVEIDTAITEWSKETDKTGFARLCDKDLDEILSKVACLRLLRDHTAMADDGSTLSADETRELCVLYYSDRATGVTGCITLY